MAKKKVQGQGAQVFWKEAYFEVRRMTKDEAQHRDWTFCEAILMR